MELESHATPARTTPEQRYAVLHRAIERGMVSDAVWKELTEVSIALGHTEEALGCIERIESESIRHALQARMRHRRAAQHEPDVPPRPAGSGTAGSGPAEARDPARAARAEQPRDRDEWDRDPTLAEHLGDAVQFLFVQHMPWLCLLTTLSFPLIVGLGGFLTTGIAPLGVAAITALPGLCVLALICAMGRSILVESSRGAIDPPPFPEVRALARDSFRWGAGGLVVLAAFAAPIVAAVWLEADFRWLAGAIALAAVFAPMAFVFSQVLKVSASLSPWRLLVAAKRGGLSYLGLALVSWAMLAPPALVAWYVLGQPLWIQISAIGPTAVLPVFVCARMVGTWLEARQARFADLLFVEPARAAKAAEPTADEAARPQRANPTARPAPAGRRNAGGPPPRRRQAPRGAARAIEGRSPRRQRPSEVPDLRYMPGAFTVSGRERAASRATAHRE